MAFFLLRKYPQHLISIASNVHRHGVGHLGGEGVGAFGIRENVQIGDVQIVDKVIRFQKIFVRFVRKTHDNVDANARMRHDGFYFFNPTFVMFSLVAAAHLLQLFVVSRLQRNVKMGRKTLAFCHKINDFVGQKIGFDARNSEATNAFHFIQFLNQINEKSFFFSRFSFNNFRSVAKVTDVDAR